MLIIFSVYLGTCIAIANTQLQQLVNLPQIYFFLENICIPIYYTYTATVPAERCVHSTLYIKQIKILANHWLAATGTYTHSMHFIDGLRCPKEVKSLNFFMMS